ncbi:MAG: hypothetical protein ACRDGE_05860 [Candidatus Limnocylindria bacterium]
MEAGQRQHPFRVSARFEERGQAESAVEALRDSGFEDEEISIVARGAFETSEEDAVPGGLYVTVSADHDRERAESVLREAGAPAVQQRELPIP